TSNSSLIKCASASDEPIHQSLCKTTSEPPRSPHHNTTSGKQIQYSRRQNSHDQNCFHAPMISSQKKKLQRQNSIYIPSSPRSLQSTFTWENNLNQNIQSYYHDPLTRSLSTESSTSSTSTSNNVDTGGKGEGNHSDQLSHPDGIVLDKNGPIFICDNSNRRIQRWHRNDSQGVTIVQNISCWGLAMDHEESLYISDQTDQHQVLKWPTGKVVAGGNGKGSALNQLSGSSYLFVDQDQSVYIADGDNDRIVKWSVRSTEGVSVAGGNGRGDGANQFNEPTAVIIDQMGTMYVSDYHNHRITA
ncbi:unnamed protein product, partial [Rotaria sp. Silwood2]